MKRVFLPIFLLAAFSLGAQSANVKLEEDLLQFRVLTVDNESEKKGDLSRFIGLLPAEAIYALGAPAEVFPQRGGESLEDTVVFYYDNHLYLYWYGNRVWQVRADRRYEGAVMRVFLGMKKNLVRDILGMPYYIDGESFMYRLQDKGYPVKVRFFFKDDALEDVYFYRGDY